ncbi:MAG: response regulator [Kiritimatiellae bacterium]|nr:response regulator [Kiritimatiellia bacterium]
MSAKSGSRFDQTMRISIPQPAERKSKPKQAAKKKRTVTITRRRLSAPVQKKPDAADRSRYSALLQSIYDAVLVTDVTGNIIDANVRAEDFFLRGKEQLIQLRIADMVAGFDQSVLKTICDNADQRRFTLMEAYSVREDGTMFPSEIAVHKLHTEEDEQLCFLIRDITVRKQAQEALRWAHKRKLESLQNLAGGVAHDFNNKLTGVIGNAQLALQALPEDSEVRADLQRIIDNAEEMAELSQKMLAYSGRGHFLSLPMNLSTVVSEFEHILRQKVTPKILLETKLDRDVQQMSGDRGEIEQMLLHLVKNANESIGGAQGTITINTSTRFCDDQSMKPNFPEERVRPGYYVCLEVSDNGQGMDSATLKRVFDPFFTTKFVGRGLGLAAVLGIVQGHGGMIAAQSEVERGTTFSLYFPVLKEKAVPVRPRPPAPRPEAVHAKILIAEEDDSIRDLARRSLEDAGYSTLVAANGPQCVDMFRVYANQIDLVLLDMTMPGMKGAEVLADIRRIRPEVRVLLSSGYSESQVNREFTDQQPDGFMHKPFQMRELVEKVADMLRD